VHLQLQESRHGRSTAHNAAATEVTRETQNQSRHQVRTTKCFAWQEIKGTGYLMLSSSILQHVCRLQLGVD
jgi:hypothetical protein